MQTYKFLAPSLAASCFLCAVGFVTLAGCPVATPPNAVDAGTNANTDAGAPNDDPDDNPNDADAGAAPAVVPVPTQTTWQIQLDGERVNRSIDVRVYDVDLFETEEREIRALHDDGRLVMCYFSAGTFEPFRDDADLFPDDSKGKPLEPPFDDELWLDIRNDAIRSIVEQRLDVAVSKQCDGVDPDNVDGFANDTGFALDDADQLAFNIFVAEAAHQRGLSVGLKNDLDQLDDLEPHFDWAVNEECVKFDECNRYRNNFLRADKAVFHIEYIFEDFPDELGSDLVTLDELDADLQAEVQRICNETRSLHVSTLIKNLLLDAPQIACE